MRNPFCLLALLVLSVVAWPGSVRAAHSYDGCDGFIDSLPAVITTQGTWCLRQDLSTALSSGAAITVATNNVIIDCNDFKLGGLQAGPGTAASGIVAINRLNVTVRHCNVRGFYYGLDLFGGGGHVVERNRLDGNTILGVYVNGQGSVIRDNLIVDTGGSSLDRGSAWGVFVSQGVDVVSNIINGVAAMPDGGNASSYGISSTENGAGTVSGNRIRGLFVAGTGVSRGVRLVASSGAVVNDNIIQGSGSANQLGIDCSSVGETARGNTITGFATGISGCAISGNYINAN